jgi:Zn-dependent protease with chaperone function
VKVRKWGHPVTLLLALLALSCMAQDSNDESPDDGADFRTTATLWLAFDGQGAANVNLDLPKRPQSWDELRSSLGQALHCPVGQLNNPGDDGRGLTSLPKEWTASQRNRYLKQLAQINQRRLTGKCDAVLARRQGVTTGEIDYAPFAAEVARAGAEELSVSVTFPEAEFEEYTRTGLISEHKRSDASLAYLTYRIPTGADSKTTALHLAYGFRQSDVNRAFTILAGFILLPLLATLGMRHSALTSGKADPTAAWFGFFRTFNLLVTGAMLLWITSGLGARSVLQHWIGGLGLSTWQWVTVDVLILVGPSFLLYFLCVAMSYPVHAQLRGSAWTWREFMAQQLVTVGGKALPLMLALASLEILHQELEVSVAFLILAFLMFQGFVYLKLRVMKSFPQPLETGELRDRIFALAERLGVKVLRVFVLPAGKGQVANAYAAKNKIVMFTDYLLQHLSQREVDGVAAHELAHLVHKHPAKRGVAFAAAIFLPSYFTWILGMLTALIGIPLAFLPASAGRSMVLRWWLTGTGALADWPQKDFVLVMLGLTGFYFVSRHFENVADATAVRLTGDPEAQITGLLRISRLNFTPIQWGKLSESWLTHPSIVRRAQRIAAAGGMAPERLREILVQYNAEAVRRDTAMPTVPAEDRYAVPAVNDPEIIRRAMGHRALAKLKLWTLFSMYVFPPALFWLLIQKIDQGPWAFAVLIAGMLVTGGLITLAGVWLGNAGQARDKRRLVQHFEREHVPVGRAGDVLVGFAPTAFPRIFGSQYHWDSGFLVLARDRLQFVGEKTRFSLTTAEIDGIVLGSGGPNWWRFERIYVRWKETAGVRNGVFNLYLLEPGSMWTARARLRELCQRLQTWHRQGERYPAVKAELAELPSPNIGEVTCASPRSLGTLRMNLRIMGYLLPLAVCVGILLHAAIWYLCSTAIMQRLFHSIPYWRYRDTLPEFSPACGADPASKVRAASASTGDSK